MLGPIASVQCVCCTAAEGVQADQDLFNHMDPHRAHTHHSVKQHGRLGSHPYEQLDYHKHTMVTTEAMHTMGGHMQGTFRALTGREITKAMATYEVTANNRSGSMSACPRILVTLYACVHVCPAIFVNLPVSCAADLRIVHIISLLIMHIVCIMSILMLTHICVMLAV